MCDCFLKGVCYVQKIKLLAVVVRWKSEQKIIEKTKDPEFAPNLLKKLKSSQKLRKRSSLWNREADFTRVARFFLKQFTKTGKM
jgi:hypothetical protein